MLICSGRCYQCSGTKLTIFITSSLRLAEQRLVGWMKSGQRQGAMNVVLIRTFSYWPATKALSRVLYTHTKKDGLRHILCCTHRIKYNINYTADLFHPTLNSTANTNEKPCQIHLLPSPECHRLQIRIMVKMHGRLPVQLAHYPTRLPTASRSQEHITSQDTFWCVILLCRIIPSFKRTMCSQRLSIM